MRFKFELAELEDQPFKYIMQMICIVCVVVPLTVVLVAVIFVIGTLIYDVIGGFGLFATVPITALIVCLSLGWFKIDFSKKKREWE